MVFSGRHTNVCPGLIKLHFGQQSEKKNAVRPTVSAGHLSIDQSVQLGICIKRKPSLSVLSQVQNVFVANPGCLKA